MPAVQLSRTELDYLAAFDITAICVSHTGRVTCTRNPRDVDIRFVWWCKATHAATIANAAAMNADVVGAAQRLGVTITTHAVVAARVKERTAKIDAALKQALDQGTLKMFNAEYRKRRLAAQAAGKPFMTYGTAHARLRRVVTEMIARGGLLTQSLVRSVFDDPRTKTKP